MGQATILELEHRQILLRVLASGATDSRRASIAGEHRCITGQEVYLEVIKAQVFHQADRPPDLSLEGTRIKLAVSYERKLEGHVIRAQREDGVAVLGHECLENLGHRLVLPACRGARCSVSSFRVTGRGSVGSD